MRRAKVAVDITQAAMAKKKWKMVTLTTVDDVIAEDWWEVRHQEKRFVAHIA